MTYLQDWKNAKTNFEKLTKTKKPAETFLGVFRKSSGMETACKTLDEALKKGDPTGMAKARTAYDTASKTYEATLTKSDVASKDISLKTEILGLYRAMVKIGESFTADCDLQFEKTWTKVKQKYGEFVNKCNEDFKSFETLLKDGQDKLGKLDEQLRALIEAKVATDAKRVKSLGAGIPALVKAVVDVAVLATKNKEAFFKRIDTTRAALIKEAGPAAEVKKNANEASRLSDKLEMAIDGTKEKLTEILELKSQAEAMKQKALDAVKGTLDTAKVYHDTCKRLIKQSETAFDVCSSGVLDAESRCDAANFDVMNAKEKHGDVAEEFKVVCREVDKRLEELLKIVDNLEKRIETTHKGIGDRWTALPENIRGDDQFKQYGKTLSLMRSDLNKREDNLAKLRNNISKLQGKLKK